MMTSDVPELGTIRLFDRVVPPLLQGEYKLQMTQDLPDVLSLSTDEQNLGADGGDRYFEITGPRWHLDPTGIHSMTPPNKEQNAVAGAYVPMVVLGRRTLPWERSLFLDGYDGDNTNPDSLKNQLMDTGFTNEGTAGNMAIQIMTPATEDYPHFQGSDFPTMALLLFTEDELTYNKGQEDEYVGIYKADKGLKLVETTDDHPTSNSDEEGIFHNAPADFKGAMGIDSAEMESMVVDAVKVPTHILKRVCPTLGEVKLLSHARQVNPMDKEQCGSDEDGWFATCVANRVPSKPNTKYHACLVSLEGRLRDRFIPLVTPTLNTRPPGGIVKNRRKHKMTTEMKSAAKSMRKSEGKSTRTKSKKKGWFGFSTKKIVTLMKLLIATNPSTSKDMEAVIAPPEMEQIREDIRDVAPPMVFLDPPTRLVMLHHWTFTTGVGGDYESRMKSLKLRIEDPGDSAWEIGDLVEKIDLLNFNYTCRNCGVVHPFKNWDSPPPSTCVGTGDQAGCGSQMPSRAHAEPMLLGNAMVRDMTANSYLVTNMVHSDGGTTEALYRGPCIAMPENHNPKNEPYGNSDQATGYLPNIDMDDISHASAFELGRLLAMTDESFLKTAARWRRSLYHGSKISANVDQIASKGSFFSVNAELMRALPIDVQLQLPTLLSLKAASTCVPAYVSKADLPSIAALPESGVVDPSPEPTEWAFSVSEQIHASFDAENFGLTGEGPELEIEYLSNATEYDPGGAPE